MLANILKSATTVKLLSFIDSATSTGTTITVPSTAQSGDIIVLTDTALATSGVPSTAVPTGFTIISNLSSLTSRTILSYFVSTSNLASTSLTGMVGTSSANKVLAVFRLNTGVLTNTLSSVNGEFTAGDPVAQTVTSGSGSPPLVVIASYRQATATSQTFSPSADAVVAQGAVALRYKIYNNSPANVTVDMGDGGAVNILQSCYISFT
jgi:hypothetical protein